MRLEWISIKNFRRIDDLEFNVHDFTSLIGPNNACKSTILRAIQLFLEGKKPTADDWPRRNDREVAAPESIFIEGRFGSLEPWETEAPGVAGLVYEEKIRLRVEFSRDADKIENKYTSWGEFEAFDWSTPFATLPEAWRELANELGFRSKTAWDKKDNKRRWLEEAKRQNLVAVEKGWSSESISFPNALQQAIPQAIFIPAVCDATEEAKPAAKTAFGQLLNRIVLPAIKGSEEYQTFLTATGALRTLLRPGAGGEPTIIGEVGDEISRRMSEIIDVKALLGLEEPDADKFIGTNINLTLNDGVETPIWLQGDGVQRSLIFALLDFLGEQMRKTGDKAGDGEASHARATVLLFEEPELYVHPHLMRRLKNVLKRVSERPGWQVLVSTHSPFLIDVADAPESLVILRQKESGSPGAHQVPEGFFKGEDAEPERQALRAALDFHPSVCEAFFANDVVLVEGDSELAILKHSEALYQACDVAKEVVSGVTVVSCGGKWTIPGLGRLLKSFNVPFRVIHDRDRKGQTEEELKESLGIHPFKANQPIQALVPADRLLIHEDNLEEALNIPGKSQKDKPYRAWRFVRDIVAKGKVGENKALIAMVRFAFCRPGTAPAAPSRPPV